MPSSPFARKIRIALAEKGVPVELQVDIPWDSDSQTSQYNPLRKLPILIKHNGTSVFGSQLILEWIEYEYPPPQHRPLYPQVKEREILAKQVEVLADGICDAAVLVFFEQQREHPSREWMDRQRTKVESGLKNASLWVREKEFIILGKFTVADIAMGSMLSYMQLRFADDWKVWAEQYPALQRYSNQIEERQSFKSSVLTPNAIKDKIV